MFLTVIKYKNRNAKEYNQRFCIIDKNNTMFLEEGGIYLARTLRRIIDKNGNYVSIVKPLKRLDDSIDLNNLFSMSMGFNNGIRQLLGSYENFSNIFKVMPNSHFPESDDKNELYNIYCQAMKDKTFHILDADKSIKNAYTKIYQNFLKENFIFLRRILIYYK